MLPAARSPFWPLFLLLLWQKKLQQISAQTQENPESQITQKELIRSNLCRMKWICWRKYSNRKTWTRNESLNCRGGQNRFDLVISWVNVSDPIWQKSAAEAGCEVKEYLEGSGDVDVFQVQPSSLFFVVQLGVHPNWICGSLGARSVRSNPTDWKSILSGCRYYLNWIFTTKNFKK